MAFDPKAMTERLDKIAAEVEEINPILALQLDKVSDVLEGRKEATSLKFDADEARYMADHFNYKARSINPDEPYMNEYNKSDFSQVSDAYSKMPGHASGAAAPAAPAAAPAPAAVAPVVEEKEAVAPVVEEKAAPEMPKEASFSAPYRKVK